MRELGVDVTLREVLKTPGTLIVPVSVTTTEPRAANTNSGSPSGGRVLGDTRFPCEGGGSLRGLPTASIQREKFNTGGLNSACQ